MGGLVVALLAATVGVLTLTAAPVSATTASVANDTQYRAALLALSGDNTGPHVIDITADFTITLAGDPTYTGTQPLTIEGNGHTINGGAPGDPHRILNHNTAQTLTVNNLTLTNGKPAFFGDGGAIRASGSVTATGSTFTDNTTTGPPGGSGGAIYADGSVTATGSTFTNNTANSDGGTIYSVGAVTATNSTFTTNPANVFGGAILTLFGAVTATGSTFTNNTANSGGGAILTIYGAVTATNSTFTGHTANFGGAIYGTVSVTATGSTFTGNTAHSAGGAIFDAGSVTATNSTFTGNTANGTNPNTANGGGAIYGGNVTLAYATVVENTAPQGANVFASGGLESLWSVVAGPLGGGANCSLGTGSNSIYSFADDLSCQFGGTGDSESVANDPLLLGLGNFGGPTQTRPPQPSSPLVDAIPVSACSPPVVAHDQRGLPRPANGNANFLDGNGCDIGAVELQPAPAPPPPPPPPPLPPEICQNQPVTVDLARGQTPTNGPDVIRGTTGADIINALGGGDIICALGGDDIVSGNQGDDTMYGSSGDDEMRGNAGNDTLRGRAGDDLLYGQAGNDTLGGGPDTDTCRGGTGVDTAIACETTVGVP